MKRYRTINCLLLMTLLGFSSVVAAAEPTKEIDRERIPRAAVVDSSVISATLVERQAWVREQKRRNREFFERNYYWILSKTELDENAAKAIAEFFYYSTDRSCGFFDGASFEDGIWRFRFHAGSPVPGHLEGRASNRVCVRKSNGEVWQEGQTETVDSFALIRFE